MKVLKNQGDHENILIQDASHTRKKLIRQDRVPVTNKSFTIPLPDGVLEVLNYSPFGVAVVSSVALKPNQEYLNIPFQYEGYELGKFHLRIAHQTQTSDGKFQCGVEILGEPLDINSIKAIDFGGELVGDIDFERSSEQNIPAFVKKAVLEVKDWLEILQTACNNLEGRLDWEDPEVTSVQAKIADVIGEWLGRELPSLYSSLAKQMAELSETEIRASIGYFRKKLRHLVYQSPIADRAYRKPLGYAGDYQMMNIIYDSGVTGSTLFSKCMHRYFVTETASKAVRNRAHFLRDKIINVLHHQNPARSPKKILSVACGPARELELALMQAPEVREINHEFQLLDQDTNALQHAQKRLMIASRKLNHKFNVKFLNLAIKNIIVRGLPEDGYDLIYSAGLFDYFSDPVAAMAAEKLFKSVKPGGTLIIGNFDIKNPSQTVMELVLDWELIYRSSEQLLKLFSHLPGTLKVEEEGEKVNLFCVIQKPL